MTSDMQHRNPPYLFSLIDYQHIMIFFLCRGQMQQKALRLLRSAFLFRLFWRHLSDLSPPETGFPPVAGLPLIWPAAVGDIPPHQLWC